ncbi:Uncharacterised protein [Acinetobacter haemolyticus]|uniref:Uncharacterized protein n=1 Tax=Acinetobacter haemolyticus CIP 64.3 = MTCC 9819 TaxID=1217659 RepID=N9F2X1_ACIHA|nr:hypothetical protein F927_02365 [Acinetobacter haemolyticus CIP 64.3 = MTCC 9819]SPT46248.1 Uncharacterised protein [Acinetobacter haemolyticus]SUU63490.1 Uncharacterised protein [Acinetobacter haemolyticus]
MAICRITIVRAHMLNTRDLKGLACGLADTFISRNNDIQGYWGIGMLHLELKNRGETHVELNLLSEQGVPNGVASDAAASRYSTYLANRLAGRPLASALITVEFGSFGGYPEPQFSSSGHPFVCIVRLVSATGKEYSCARTGRSWPHSSREIRSSRSGL